MPVVELVTCLLLSVPTPVRLPAEVDDAYSLKTNPAGLGFVSGAELRLVGGRSLLMNESSVGLFTAVPLGRFATVGLGVEWDNFTSGNTDTTVSLGMGRRVGPLSLGFGWRNPVGGSDWSLGLSLRVARWLALSASTQDLAENIGPRIYDLGLALRPLHERVLLSARWRILDGEALDWDEGKPKIDARLEVEPIDGLFLGASTDLNARLAFQISVVLGKLVLGSLVSTDVDARQTDAIIGELAIRQRPGPPLFKRRRVAVIELAGELVPEPRLNLMQRRLDYAVYGTMPLMLERLAESEDLLGLFVKIGPLDVGWAKVEELRDGLLAVKAKGYRIDCELGNAGDAEMFLASACTKIIVPPPLQLAVDGVAANALFFGEGLDRLGAHPEVFRVGPYKTSPDMFSRSGMSPEQRETLTDLVEEIWQTLLHGLSEGRGLALEKVESIVAQGTLTATQAQALGLVDAVLYPDQVEAWIHQQYGARVSFSDPASLLPERRPRWDTMPRIAVIPIDSTITGGDSQSLPFGFSRTSGASTIVQALERARTDPSIRAIVLQVNSPGGDALASDLIARAVKQANVTKPVIASFGDVAASGGYYVAAGARAIYALPTSITGSIGVYSIGLSPEALLSKLGIAIETVQRGEGANRFNPLADMTDAERQMQTREVRAIYEQFLRVVAEGRKMDRAQVDAVAQGRVWTGRAAKERGLVDELGTLEDAIQRAKTEAGLGKDVPIELVVLPDERVGFPRAVRQVFVPDTPVVDLAALLPPSVRHQASLFMALMTGRVGVGPFAVLPAVLRFD